MPVRGAGAPKALLETIQVARHVGRLGFRPVQKIVHQVGQVSEDCAVWAIKLPPVQGVIGRENSKALLDSYFQAKEVVGEGLSGFFHQSWGSALQTGAQFATMGMRHCGMNGRVIGPFDEHWHALNVIKTLRIAEQERADHSGHPSMQLTPRRFVQFMRDAERKRKRVRQRDPVEDYVEQMLQSGTMSSMGPREIEKKLYTDVARVICFAFDRVLFEANGLDVWGHSLNIRVAMEGRGEAPMASRPHFRSAVSMEQVEHLVDRMLKSKDLEVPAFMQGLQRQLLINCAMMLLHLLEDLTSERHMQMNLLGHSLGVVMEPLPTHQLWDQEVPDEMRTFHINTESVNELVNALIDEPEVQLILLPDALEAEIYRLVLHRMLCIGQFMLSQLRIRLFGSEVRLEFTMGEASAETNVSSNEATAGQVGSVSFVPVLNKDVRIIMSRLDAERASIERELKRRQLGEDADFMQSLDEPTSGQREEVHHQFENMALQDRLSRSLSIQRVIDTPIEVAYMLVSDVVDYPKWMPFCTGSRVLSSDQGNIFHCEVGLGLSTGTLLGIVGDNIKYRVMVYPPAVDVKQDGTTQAAGLRVARVVADTPAGFAYGKRLVYDWRFYETATGETDVRLDMFFQARSVWFMPLWDSMQAMVSGSLLKKFQVRAKDVAAQRGFAGAAKIDNKAVY